MKEDETARGAHGPGEPILMGDRLDVLRE